MQHEQHRQGFTYLENQRGYVMITYRGKLRTCMAMQSKAWMTTFFFTKFLS